LPEFFCPFTTAGEYFFRRFFFSGIPAKVGSNGLPLARFHRRLRKRAMRGEGTSAMTALAAALCLQVRDDCGRFDELARGDDLDYWPGQRTMYHIAGNQLIRFSRQRDLVEPQIVWVRRLRAAEWRNEQFAAIAQAGADELRFLP